MNKNQENIFKPNNIEEIIGQKHLMPLLKKIIKKGNLISLILHGEPGVGKSSIAFALVKQLNLSFFYFNSTKHSKKELEYAMQNFKTIIIDEIHRLNKDKQDILLPYLEENKINIIATTTENPYFSIIPALRSRTHIFRLNKISEEDIIEGLKKIIKKNNWKINIDKENLKKIANISNGDLRYAINCLNIINKFYKNRKITTKIIKEIMPEINLKYDKKGENHFNLLSAFHKSLRGSDINGSLYYLYQLIQSKDLIGMERRMIMVCYEDIGFANPNISLRITTALENAKKVGFPEARIILAYAVIDICKAKKSNSSYVAINNVEQIIKKIGTFEMPEYLKEFQDKEKIKISGKYKYPHNFQGSINQEYLPKELKGIKFFEKNKNDKI